MNKYLGIIVFVVATSGCSNYTMVVKNSLNVTGELALHTLNDVEKVKNSKTFKITKINIEPAAIQDTADVEKSTTRIVPLILYNSWKHVSVHHLGRNQISNSLEEYVQYAFEQGLRQAGYEMVDNNPELQIELNVKRMKASGYYSKGGNVIIAIVVVSHNSYDYKGPYIGDVLIDVSVKNGDRKYTNEVFGKRFLKLADFNNDIDKDYERVFRVLELSVSDAVSNYLKVVP